MKISLQEFKKKFSDDFLEIHWRQWSALGLSSQVSPERKWIIDLEALVLSTFSLELRDSRLYQNSISWLLDNRSWLNLSRLKRMAGVDLGLWPGLAPGWGPLFDPERFESLVSMLQKNGREKVGSSWPNRMGRSEESSRINRRLNKNSKIKKAGVDPILQNSSLLQLKLRGLFGIDARAELLIYFLSHKNGNSNSIAREVCSDQKNIYRILENWRQAGILNKIKEPKAGIYALERGNDWLEALGLKSVQGFLNWNQAFPCLDLIFKAIYADPWSEDEYLLSSFFRDILNDASKLGENLGVRFPAPDQYPGAEFFSPFGQKIIEVVDLLIGSR